MRFAKAQEKKMGMPEQPVLPRKMGPQKSPISKVWIGGLSPFFFLCFLFGPSSSSGVEEKRDDKGVRRRRWHRIAFWTNVGHLVLLAFVLCGGLLFEVLKLFF